MDNTPSPRRPSRGLVLAYALPILSAAIYAFSPTATATSHFPNIELVAAIVAAVAGLWLGLRALRKARTNRLLASGAALANAAVLFLWAGYIIWFAVHASGRV